MRVQNRPSLWQNAHIHRHLWSIPAASPLLWPNGIHAHNHTDPAGTRGKGGDGSWCQRSTAREEGIRLKEIRMLTRVGRPNRPSRMGERLGSIIPLEELPTGTPI